MLFPILSDSCRLLIFLATVLRIQSNQASLFQNFTDGALSEAVERVQQLRERQNSLKRQLKHYSTLAEQLATVDKDTTLTTSLIDQVIERVTISGPEDISIQFRCITSAPLRTRKWKALALRTKKALSRVISPINWKLSIPIYV